MSHLSSRGSVVSHDATAAVDRLSSPPRSSTSSRRAVRLLLLITASAAFAIVSLLLLRWWSVADEAIAAAHSSTVAATATVDEFSALVAVDSPHHNAVAGVVGNITAPAAHSTKRSTTASKSTRRKPKPAQTTTLSKHSTAAATRAAVAGERFMADCGIVWIVYGSSENDSFLKLAVNSARMYRTLSPTLPLALLTDAVDTVTDMVNGSSPFSHVLAIPSSMLYEGRQWLTRVESIRQLLPYRLTLLVDSDTIPCVDLSTPLLQLAANKKNQFAVSAGSHDPLVFWPDNGVLLIDHSAPAFDELMDAWVAQQQLKGAAADDQLTLRAAGVDLQLQRDSGMRAQLGRLSPQLTCRLHPGRNQTWSWGDTRRYDQTLVLAGPVYIAHMAGLLHSTAALCELLNSKPTKKRVVVWKDHQAHPHPSTTHKFKSAFDVAYSPAQCDQLLDGHCHQLVARTWDRASSKPLVSPVKY